LPTAQVFRPLLEGDEIEEKNIFPSLTSETHEMEMMMSVSSHASESLRATLRASMKPCRLGASAKCFLLALHSPLSYGIRNEPNEEQIKFYRQLFIVHQQGAAAAAATAGPASVLRG